MSPERILIVVGHPVRQSYCGELARSYKEGALAKKAEVHELYLGELNFDPLLRNGYAKIQPLEPDLVQAQAEISWANHLVIIYPNWWGMMPALLKGFIDRTFLPGFAFKFSDENNGPAQKLFAGKSAHMIVTTDMERWYHRWLWRNPGHQVMKRAILEFCGINPVRVTTLPVQGSTPEQRAHWIRQVKKFGSHI